MNGAIIGSDVSRLMGAKGQLGSSVRSIGGAWNDPQLNQLADAIIRIAAASDAAAKAGDAAVIAVNQFANAASETV